MILPLFVWTVLLAATLIAPEDFARMAEPLPVLVKSWVMLIVAPYRLTGPLTETASSIVMVPVLPDELPSVRPDGVAPRVIQLLVKA